MRTQVAVVGAGPAGLLLAHLLRLEGIDAVVLETRRREHVLGRIRAGVLEPGTVELLREVGLGARLDRVGLEHQGFSLRFDGTEHRIGLAELTGKSITVYGQQEVVRDLIDAAEPEPCFGVSDVALRDVTTDRPSVTFTDAGGTRRTLHCDVIAGCDGFHGVSRSAVPATGYERTFPYSWLGILAKTAPVHHELIYAHHERGFALHSMRSPELTRLYLQVEPDERIEDWPDERIWDELAVRLGTACEPGPLVEKGITAMRAFVAEPMRHGRLFLAGDAAHIVPPTGAKGLNLAVADVRLLSRALTALLLHGREGDALSYSDTRVRGTWRAERFSTEMTEMLHRSADPFERRLSLARLRRIASSTAAATALAQDYVGISVGVSEDA
ncbi:4-hydroxybenzoate 3-monooxygenase [Allokutzneria sp. A3M-2-11 16]|uniref:4-hydroxybenzoate 3-monooxygenase n=1 Tax=Allokutzneria sp. A3M-2-11 16 TaxID=2962043 RepID=UPI0020B7BBCE|nr:4-hydroxybenzoate 3-monooxygenase [Allokutzneria sp. A3M-2-11 16]MCP3801409.1 4-hydroxybenzoate 3-monooxygenase [Allokutzneria sp. A3M-2-11 16]